MSYGTVQAEKMTTESGYSLGAGNASSFKNRIINGGMVIDQRNNGASVSAGTGYTYPVDRSRTYKDSTITATYTVQRSTVAPAGFTNSYLVTVTGTESSFTSAEIVVPFEQAIEGFNVADLGWGTANAKPVTVSFWFRSSVAGTYPVAVFNNTGSTINRSYVSTFTVNAANTWEYETITIPGDTSGTWQTGNGIGLYLAVGAAGGSNFVAPAANAWNAAFHETVAGTVNLFATNGATLYITGVQLEVGTVATSFDYRSYGTELDLCQRYFQIVGGTGTEHFATGVMNSNRVNIIYGLKQTMRASPAFSATNFGSAFSNLTIYWGSAQASCNGSNENYMSPNNVSIGFTHASSSTPGDAGYIYFNSTAARVAFDAEV